MSGSSSQQRLREALNAGAPSSSKDKGPAAVDGVLSADTAELSDWRSRLSQSDSLASTSTYLEPDDGEQLIPALGVACTVQPEH